MSKLTIVSDGDQRESRIVVWCLSCGNPHPHRFYVRCPYCLSYRRDERERWMGEP